MNGTRMRGISKYFYPLHSLFDILRLHWHNYLVHLLWTQSGWNEMGEEVYWIMRWWHHRISYLYLVTMLRVRFHP